MTRWNLKTLTSPLNGPLRTRRALLLLALEVVLMVPTCVPQQAATGSRSVDQYWAETGLGSSELEQLLSQQSCFQDHRHLLGCVNAISAMAERYEFVFETDGRLTPMTADAIDKRLTEKKELTSWEAKLTGEDISLDFSFLDLWNKIDTELIKPQERSSVIATGINAFISVTRDPHSYILPLSMYEEVVARSDSRPMHLGFISERVSGGAFVRKVFFGSPAFIAGLKKGDRILELNGQLVSHLHPIQFSEMLKVQEGGRISLLIERLEKGQTSEKYLEIVKTDLPYPNVLSRMLEGEQSVGLLTVHKFSRDTCAEVKQHLIGLKEEGLKGLILDLRDNPGGQVDESACILSLFTERGQLLFETRFLDQTRPTEKYRSEQETLFKGPLSVLINGGSASASEIVAGALKDLGRATLVGERSFGKGSFQDGRLWTANPRIAFFETQGMYYFPSGWTPQLVGLQPDLKVTSLEDESLREEDLFYQPLRPSDFWDGPQSLGWTNSENCLPHSLMSDEDPQIEKAWAQMSCDVGGSHDRHGSL